MSRLKLDRVWWLVSPGNPLKDDAGLTPATVRLAEARRVAAHPRIVACDLENMLGTRYTYDVLSRLVARCPAARFVWLMGGDNLLQFDRWRRWRDIAALIPIAVIDRPGSTWRAAHSRAAMTLAERRIPELDAGRLADCAPPALTIIHGPRSALSSTAVRKAQGRGR